MLLGVRCETEHSAARRRQNINMTMATEWRQRLRAVTTVMRCRWMQQMGIQRRSNANAGRLPQQQRRDERSTVRQRRGRRGRERICWQTR